MVMYASCSVMIRVFYLDLEGQIRLVLMKCVRLRFLLYGWILG